MNANNLNKILIFLLIRKNGLSYKIQYIVIRFKTH